MGQLLEEEFEKVLVTLPRISGEFRNIKKFLPSVLICVVAQKIYPSAGYLHSLELGYVSLKFSSVLEGNA